MKAFLRRKRPDYRPWRGVYVNLSPFALDPRPVNDVPSFSPFRKHTIMSAILRLRFARHWLWLLLPVVPGLFLLLVASADLVFDQHPYQGAMIGHHYDHRPSLAEFTAEMRGRGFTDDQIAHQAPSLLAMSLAQHERGTTINRAGDYDAMIVGVVLLLCAFPFHWGVRRLPAALAALERRLNAPPAESPSGEVAVLRYDQYGDRKFGRGYFRAWLWVSVALFVSGLWLATGQGLAFVVGAFFVVLAVVGALISLPALSKIAKHQGELDREHIQQQAAAAAFVQRAAMGSAALQTGLIGRKSAAAARDDSGFHVDLPQGGAS